jgi:WD40 repeat protein
LKAGKGGVLDARYSPDGKRIATAGEDGTIHIWPLDGGDPIVLSGHDGPVNTVGFNPRGDRLVSGGTDGSVRIWDPSGGKTLVVLHTHGGNVSGVAFSPDGKQVVSGAADGIWVAACEVCGSFDGVLALARTRPDAPPPASGQARP